tara:strand:+ start:61 stop:492 length:432 start_codon:yes stop_codon:yes gene_type:complete
MNKLLEQTMVRDAMEAEGILQSKQSWPSLCKEHLGDDLEALRVRPDGWGISPIDGLPAVFEAEWSNPVTIGKMDAYYEADYANAGLHVFIVTKWGVCYEVEPRIAVERYDALVESANPRSPEEVELSRVELKRVIEAFGRKIQ